MNYQYYVYVCPGHIKSFNDSQEASEYALSYGAIVKRIFGRVIIFFVKS